MKKVEIETECGEETVFYVAQDVETITVDGEEWTKKADTELDKEEITVDINHDVERYGAGYAFLAYFSNGSRVYANSDGRIEYWPDNIKKWNVLQVKGKYIIQAKE